MPSSLDSEQTLAVAKVNAREFRSFPVGWLVLKMLLIGLLGSLLTRPDLRTRFVPALVITSCFAVAACMLRGVTSSGAIAGFMVTALIFIAAGLAAFGAVVLVFVLTYSATRFGRSRKQSLQIAERASGRDAAQILANLGLAALLAALAKMTRWHVPLLTGSVAALAEAASDTVSSETGKALAKAPRLITSWQRVAAGTDGAISIAGTFLGVLAAGFVALEAALTGTLSARFAIIAVCAGILGMLFDSLLGATLERRSRLTNNAVNLIATGFTALLAAFAAWQFS